MNALKPLEAVIKDIKAEADGVKTYALKVKDGLYQGPAPGQFNMVGLPGVGEAPISVSSLFRDGCIEHTIKAVGRVTEFIERMGKGDALHIRGPYGRGWPVGEARGKDLLLVSGGVGLAPLRPVIQAVLNDRKGFGDVSLIYGARSERHTLYMDEYDGWQAGGVSLFITVDEPVEKAAWKYSVGLITGLLDGVGLHPENTVSFICGPEIMMRFIARGLLIKGIPPSGIYVSVERRMKCGVAQCGHCQHAGLFVCRDGPVFSYREVAGLPDGML
jgi:NAD(P)H-flavin reductase